MFARARLDMRCPHKQNSYTDMRTKHHNTLVHTTTRPGTKRREYANELAQPQKKCSEDAELAQPRKKCSEDAELAHPRRKCSKDTELTQPRKKCSKDAELAHPRKKCSEDANELTQPRKKRCEDANELTQPRKKRCEDANELTQPRKKCSEDANELTQPRKERCEDANELTQLRKKCSEDANVTSQGKPAQSTDTKQLTCDTRSLEAERRGKRRVPWTTPSGMGAQRRLVELVGNSPEEHRHCKDDDQRDAPNTQDPLLLMLAAYHAETEEGVRNQLRSTMCDSIKEKFGYTPDNCPKTKVGAKKEQDSIHNTHSDQIPVACAQDSYNVFANTSGSPKPTETGCVEQFATKAMTTSNDTKAMTPKDLLTSRIMAVQSNDHTSEHLVVQKLGQNAEARQKLVRVEPVATSQREKPISRFTPRRRRSRYLDFVPASLSPVAEELAEDNPFDLPDKNAMTSKLLNYIGSLDFVRADKLDRWEALRMCFHANADINATLPDGTTTLALCAVRNYEYCVSELLRLRADVDVTDCWNSSTLLKASISGACSVRLVKLLLSARAAVNNSDVSQRTPLHYTAMAGPRATQVAIALLESKADASLRSVDGKTADDYARAHPIFFLHRKYGALAKMLAVGPKGMTVFMAACARGSCKDVQYLYRLFGYGCTKTDAFGVNAVSYAVYFRRSKTECFLRDKGFKEVPRVRTKTGKEWAKCVERLRVSAVGASPKTTRTRLKAMQDAGPKRSRMEVVEAEHQEKLRCLEHRLQNIKLEFLAKRRMLRLDFEKRVHQQIHKLSGNRRLILSERR